MKLFRLDNNCPLCVYMCVCDLVIVPQCDVLAWLITCQQVLCL